MFRTSVDQLSSISVIETLTFEKGIVDLWYYFYEDAEAALLTDHKALLTPDERERYGNFRFEPDRRLFLATRALVRTVLSNYAAVSPGDWHFAANRHGKPFVSAPIISPAVHFSLANTPGLVVCAVSVAYELFGVDAERIDRRLEAIEIADRYFSLSEASSLRDLPAPERTELFLAYWSLKESYVKARGIGLTLPLAQFSFRVENEISIEFGTGLADDAPSWRFALLDAPPDHIVAISVKTGGAALSMRSSRVVPLRQTGGAT